MRRDLAAVCGIVTERTKDPVQQLILDHDWKTQIARGGPVVDLLQLSLTVPEKPYKYGSSYYLFLALQNHSRSSRALTAFPACGTLSRSDGLSIRVRSNNGTELTLQNRYADNEGIHEHPFLSVSADSVLKDVLNFNTFVATSGKLFDMVLASDSLTITVESSISDFKSNAVTFSITR